MYPVSLLCVKSKRGFPPRIILPVRKLKECLKLWTGQEYAKLVWFSTIKAFLLISISEDLAPL
jgi:hypothetical protein